MALDKVIDGILESARTEANQHIQEAERERQDYLRDASQKVDRMQKAEEKEVQESLRRLRRQELSSAELEAKKIVLNRRKAMLDRTFAETLKELSSMSPKEKATLYEKILSSGKKAVSPPKVYCPRNESALISGRDGILSVEETDMESGLILESSDGTVRVDYRFRTILESIWEKELKNVSDILFG